MRLQAQYTPMLPAIPAFAQVAVLALGGWLAMNGHITLGTFLAFSTYLVQLVAPVRMLASLFAIGQQARAGGERILDILDDQPHRAGPARRTRRWPRSHGEVRFDDVRFGYTSTTPVLDGFDLHVRPGEVVALVGASGSGKSTVTALLPRFYDVAEGRVTIDGIDVRDVTLDSLRRQVGVVFEEAFLFSDSVRANIAYGRPDATDDEIGAAAVAAGADGSSATSPTATTPSSASAASRCRAASASASRWPGPCSPIPGSSCSTTPRRRSTPPPRRRSTPRCGR